MATRERNKRRREAPAVVTECGTGHIPANELRYEKAELLFYRPGIGFIAIYFGDGTNLSPEDCDGRDGFGNKIDDYVMVETYCDSYDDGVWKASRLGIGDVTKDGIMFESSDGGELLFSRKTYRSGDIRQMIVPALEFMGWPTDVSRYFLVGKRGAFRDKKTVRDRPLRWRED